MPDKIRESFKITIGYYDPVVIKVVGSAYYPSIITSLPRQESDSYKSK